MVNELTNLENKIEKKMNELLKSPQNVVELAYTDSFESRNLRKWKFESYENVYKYEADIQRFCNEIIHRLTYPQIGSILNESHFKIIMNLNKLIKHLRSFDFRTINTRNKLHEVI